MKGYSGSVLIDDIYTGHCECKMPYFINCCGYINIDHVDVSLKRTRVDWYLIYLINGSGHYKINNEIITANAGSIIIYKPGQYQEYFYKASDNTEFYWIHFTGSHMERLLNELEQNERNIYQTRISTEYINLFENIIHELQIKRIHFHELCISYLLQLLSLFLRDINSIKCTENSHKYKEIESVLKSINIEYQQEHPIEYYAAISHMSLFHFIRKFKMITGSTPKEYIEKIRIAKAKELLYDSDLSITEISNIVGYKDPFYFSKVFKKSTGIAPSVFRKNSPTLPAF